MHELSIAVSMIEMATEEAQRRGATGVNALHLKLGALSGVVKEALLFSFEVACDGTMLQGAQLVIEEVPVIVYCARCRANRQLETMQHFCCPVCGSLSTDIVSGREMEFVAMEIEESSEWAAAGIS